MAGKKTILALLLAVGIAVATAPVCAQNTGKTVRKRKVPVEESAASAMVNQAETAIEHKDYAKAEELLKQAVTQDPKDYRAWFDLAFVQNAAGRDADAIAAYRKSVEANPQIFESNLNLGLMLARTGDAEAEKYLRAATQLKPTAKPEEGLERAWLSLAHVLEAKEPKQALGAYQHAAQLQPKDAEPHLAAAILADKQGDEATAEKEFQAAAERDPKSDEAVGGLAQVYTKTRRLPQAEAALRKYLVLRPESVSAHLQLARVLAAQDKAADAVAEYEAVLKLSPKDSDAQREAGDLYVVAKQYDKAEAYYRALLQQNPGDGKLHYALGSTLMEQKKIPEAQAEFLQAVKYQPDLGLAYEKLAVVADLNKDYMLTLRALNARSRYLPEIPYTYFLRATAFDNLKDFKQAAENYHQFLLASNGKYPEQEWQARHRLIAIEPKK